MKIKSGDKVKVIAGKDKGKTGVVLRSFPGNNKVIVEGVNLVKRHQKNNRRGSQGQIIEKNLPIDVSNVALLQGDKQVRVGYEFSGEGSKRKKIRVSRPDGKKI